ncbi:translation initiation factor eIF4A [Haplosporangium sp. Z 767]|nr:translation initiation factor eIF4A [Haplosporangium sp. Z 11]KAF9190811.1 translation initiation factor eIF4A [Haplosporangium sp. Z 767]
MSQPTLAELSISLSHVQSLLKQITAEVKVLSDGIAVLVEQEKVEDLEEELNYLDVDPWSNVNDKDKKAAAASTTRQDSIRSLLQRKPSTVKDETKALARILSQKRAGGSAGSDSSGNLLSSQPLENSNWTTSILQDQVIEEDTASSERSSSSSSYRNGDSSGGGKQELEFTTDLTSATVGSLASTTQTSEAERVPHTIHVQTAQIPTKYAVAISKPTPHNPSIPVLSTSSSQGSILSAMNAQNNSNNNNNAVPPPFWRSSTAPPNVTEGSRPNSAGSNVNSEGYSIRGNIHNQALRSSSQGAIWHPPVGRDTVKSTFTVKSPPPMVATQVEKTESADCFSKLGLIPELLRGIYAYGLKMPTILQQRGIPMIMTKHDVLAQAKPEVAKTLTYAIPLLHFLTLPATSIHPQLLILCSNHDLCLHVQRVLLALARFMPTISCLICAEGSNATLSLGTISTTQVNVASQSSKNGYGRNGYGPRGGSNTEPLPVIAAHVVIGTPGKVLSLIRSKQISIEALKVMALENADILLASPLKEATISLLSMVRDPSANSNANGNANGAPGASSLHGSSGPVTTPLISPPNSGPTSPVSMAVAALNGRIMNTATANSGNNIGGGGRHPGGYGEPGARPRSMPALPLPISTSSPAVPSTTPTTNQPQLLFFSTDVPPHVIDYVYQYTTQPTKALVKGHELALKGILQFFKYLTVEDEEWRLELLCELLEDSGANRAVVFCNSDESVERVVRKVRERKGSAVGAYSDMDMATRRAALGRFRSTVPQAIFVLTDEVARDLDILPVPLVVSFDISTISNYVPRVKWIDRSNGRVGVKVNLVDGHRGEGQALRAIQQHYRTTIDDMPINRSRPVQDFESMNLKPALLRGINAYGTVSYSISILQKLDLSNPQCQALVLAPVRELAQAIKMVILALGDFLKADCQVCVGGMNIQNDIIRFKNGAQIVVGTPGRVYDILSRGALKTDSIKMLVMDGVDEIIDRGFQDQIHGIFQRLPQERIQVVVVSTIMNDDISKLTTQLMKKPVRIQGRTEWPTLNDVQQFYIDNMKEEWKLETLYDLYDSLTTKQCVIFCNTRKKADWVAEKLQACEITVSTVNVEMDPEQRKVIMDGSGVLRVLVATNQLAQSVNARQISLVVNFDMPLSKEDYIHRIGRSSQVGLKGTTINFVTAEDAYMLREIEQFYSTRILECPLDLFDLI